MNSNGYLDLEVGGSANATQRYSRSCINHVPSDSFYIASRSKVNKVQAYNHTSKRIAVIGNGALAFQVIPAFQPTAAKLVTYIRHASSISTNLAGDITKDGMGTNFAYTLEEKSLYVSDPAKFLKYRKYVESSANSV
ncbi:hypothetical protein BJX68DRAFT_266337 [Aspergillus pseudodeflectus]|uniref:Uncharacterized protein n=1 Tax=Aspergillus pseudodeflectus TaxID=176178 RepID=A0ABR4KGM3_9EURO